MKNSNRIKVTLTEHQWLTAEKNLKNKLGKSAFRFYIASELKRLQKVCNEMEPNPCMECTQISVQKAFTLPESYNAIIEDIAKKTGVTTPGLIISKFIITPLIID